ncbi:DUF1877 family protein [Flavobacterium silvaticum]|uniref:DUF1877 family protein n=1 Tax=Flavobacterium silvaticum TaxID=1852020 RepID=A0A972JFR0_9FLAO|nr:DUF1877 family protein [Flavobacterium silvaticum]NMH28244.1 DUF1877 family protein [Flavobacterium silvaticum]
MSQSVNLYQIDAVEFRKFSANQEAYDFKFDDTNSAVFDQNYEGLNFLLETYFAGEFPESLEEVFYPTEFVGEEIEFDALDFEDPEDFPESTATYFLKPEVISHANKILESLDADDVLRLYDADSFNKNDIYPTVWHTNESPDQAFNKRHLAEGFDLLKKTLADADSKGNYILYFIG